MDNSDNATHHRTEASQVHQNIIISCNDLSAVFQSACISTRDIVQVNDQLKGSVIMPLCHCQLGNRAIQFLYSLSGVSVISFPEHPAWRFRILSSSSLNLQHDPRTLPDLDVCTPVIFIDFPVILSHKRVLCAAMISLCL